MTGSETMHLVGNAIAIFGDDKCRIWVVAREYVSPAVAEQYVLDNGSLLPEGRRHAGVCVPLDRLSLEQRKAVRLLNGGRLSDDVISLDRKCVDALSAAPSTAEEMVAFVVARIAELHEELLATPGAAS